MAVQTFQGAVRIIPLGSVKKDVGSSLIGGGGGEFRKMTKI